MLNHKGTTAIKTKRLTLRRFTPDDAEAMYSNWASDTRVTKYLTWLPHSSPEATRELLENWCTHYDEKNYYNWLIEFEGEAIGNISVVKQSERDSSCDLGYCMSQKHWGKGIMTEAVEAVISFLFSKIGMHRIVIENATENPASGAVAKKCGFTLEGIRKEAFFALDGRWLDICHNAILKTEWHEQNK